TSKRGAAAVLLSRLMTIRQLRPSMAWLLTMKKMRGSYLPVRPHVAEPEPFIANEPPRRDQQARRAARTAARERSPTASGTDPDVVKRVGNSSVVLSTNPGALACHRGFAAIDPRSLPSMRHADRPILL